MESSQLALDDGVLWGALTQMGEATDSIIAEFFSRLRDRLLYKCLDIRTEVTRELDPKGSNTDEVIESIDKCCASIGARLSELEIDSGARPRILVDDEKRSPYKSIGESRGPLDQINIRTASGDFVDLKERSAVVAALKTYKLFRAYVDRDDTEARDAVERTVKGEIKACRTQTL